MEEFCLFKENSMFLLYREGIKGKMKIMPFRIKILNTMIRKTRCKLNKSGTNREQILYRLL